MNFNLWARSTHLISPNLNSLSLFFFSFPNDIWQLHPVACSNSPTALPAIYKCACHILGQPCSCCCCVLHVTLLLAPYSRGNSKCHTNVEHVMFCHYACKCSRLLCLCLCNCNCHSHLLPLSLPPQYGDHMPSACRRSGNFSNNTNCLGVDLTSDKHCRQLTKSDSNLDFNSVSYSLTKCRQHTAVVCVCVCVCMIRLASCCSCCPTQFLSIFNNILCSFHFGF